MSNEELRRGGVLARVEQEALSLVHAAQILDLSYRQTKRIWQRYQAEGAEGLRHRSVGRESDRAKPKKFRQRVLRLVRQKYSGETGNDSVRSWPPNIWGVRMGWRFTRSRYGAGCSPRACGARCGKGGRTGGGERRRSTLANWCRWTEVSTGGWNSAGRKAV